MLSISSIHSECLAAVASKSLSAFGWWFFIATPFCVCYLFATHNQLATRNLGALFAPIQLGVYKILVASRYIKAACEAKAFIGAGLRSDFW